MKKMQHFTSVDKSITVHSTNVTIKLSFKNERKILQNQQFYCAFL